MKLIIRIQNLEASGDRWKYKRGKTFVMRNLSDEDVDGMDSIYFKEYLENHFNSSYTGLPPTQEYEMQSYISEMSLVDDIEPDDDEWVVPYELSWRYIKGDVQRKLFAHRFVPKDIYWSTDEKYKDIIGYVEQFYITTKNDVSDYAKKYVKNTDSHLLLNDFIHRDFSRKPYDIYKEMEAS